jgi:uncharacterized membrane protein
MIRWLPWAIYTAIAGVVLYFIALAGVPYGVMHMIQARAAGAAGVNALLHSERPSHTSRTVVRPSPELLYSVCWFDLSQGPVRIVSGTPKNTYWSVAFYRDNTDNFFVINDTKTGGAKADLLLYSADHFAGGKAEFDAKYGAAARPDLAGAVGVESPSKRGLVLIRTLINDEDLLPEIDAERRQATCGPLTP